MTFHVERGGPNPVRFTVEVHDVGFSFYWVGPPDFDAMEAVALRKITVSPMTLDTIFAASSVVNGEKCETHLKHVAQTGKKTLAYAAAHHSATCEFNYSDDERVNLAASKMQAIAETMQIGDRLEHTHRFDRLGLDALIDTFAEEVKDRRAIEVQNIAPTLQSIVDDERVMERVRRKCARLLPEALPVK